MGFLGLGRLPRGGVYFVCFPLKGVRAYQHSENVLGEFVDIFKQLCHPS
jgi:hypothetical protein